MSRNRQPRSTCCAAPVVVLTRTFEWRWERLASWRGGTLRCEDCNRRQHRPPTPVTEPR